MKKRILVVVALCFSIIVTLSNTAFANEEEAFHRKLEIEYESNIEYNKLLSSFGAKERLSDIKDYPDNYAGAYINSEGELVVLVIDAKNSKCDEFKEIATNEALIFEEATYSYDHLQSLMNEYNKFANNAKFLNNDKLYDLHESIICVAIHDDMNCIIMEIDEINNENIALYKKYVSDSPAIKFIEGDPLEPATSIRPGSEIKVGSSYYSMGFRCTRDLPGGGTETGFVTAAHGNDVGDMVKVGATTVGQVTKSVLSGSTDAAFVRIDNSNYTGSNWIYPTGKTLYGSGYFYPAVGSTIYKSGQTTGYGVGTVSSLIASSTYPADYGGMTITSLIKATPLVDNGDSGGILFGGSTGSTVYTAGIISVKGSNYSLYTKVSNIMADLDVDGY